MIVREPGSGMRGVIDRVLADNGCAADNVVLTLSRTEAIKRAVIAGLGLAIVSRLCAELELSNGVHVEVPVFDLKMRRPLHELTLRGRQPSPSVQAFIGLLGGPPAKLKTNEGSGTKRDLVKIFAARRKGRRHQPA